MRYLVLLVLAFIGSNAHSTTPETLLDEFTVAAKQENPAFSSSSDRGRFFYNVEKQLSQGQLVSCASCHTEDPTKSGAHHKTKKVIEPLAPVKNSKRFTDAAKVEKWFKRNCNDVLERACTHAEKADFLSYLISVK